MSETVIFRGGFDRPPMKWESPPCPILHKRGFKENIAILLFWPSWHIFLEAMKGRGNTVKPDCLRGYGLQRAAAALAMHLWKFMIACEDPEKSSRFSLDSVGLSPERAKTRES